MILNYIKHYKNQKLLKKPISNKIEEKYQNAILITRNSITNLNEDLYLNYTEYQEKNLYDKCTND